MILQTLLSQFTVHEIESLESIAHDYLDHTAQLLQDIHEFCNDCAKSAQTKRSQRYPRRWEIELSQYHAAAIREVFPIPVRGGKWIRERLWRNVYCTNLARHINKDVDAMANCFKRLNQHFPRESSDPSDMLTDAGMNRSKTFDRLAAFSGSGPIEWLDGTFSSGHEAAIIMGNTVYTEWLDIRESLKIQNKRADLRRAAEAFMAECSEWFKFFVDESQVFISTDLIESRITLEAITILKAFPKLTPEPIIASESPKSEALDKNSSAVVLRGPNLPTLINGKEKRLNSTQYAVIEALARARPHGLTKEGIGKIRTDARGILTRLCRDIDWAGVIHMAKVTGGRYRLD